MPIAWALLADKTGANYKRLCQHLARLLQHTPATPVVKEVKCDFEKGIYRACEEVFQCKVELCLFHLNKNVWKKFGEKHLKTDYTANGFENAVCRAFR